LSISFYSIKIQFWYYYWRLKEIKKLNGKQKYTNNYKMHHPKPDIERIYVKRKEGGRGLLQIEVTYIAEMTNTADY